LDPCFVSAWLPTGIIPTCPTSPPPSTSPSVPASTSA
jgi:hypothetical protein